MESLDVRYLPVQPDVIHAVVEVGSHILHIRQRNVAAPVERVVLHEAVFVIRERFADPQIDRAVSDDKNTQEDRRKPQDILRLLFVDQVDRAGQYDTDESDDRERPESARRLRNAEPDRILFRVLFCFLRDQTDDQCSG